MQRSTVFSLFVAVVLVAALAGCLQLGSDANDDGLEGGDEGTVTEADAGTEGEDADADDDYADDTDAETDTDTDTDENATATFLESTGPTENVTVTLEVAANGTERAEGLMYRESLPENHGMVFVYADEDQRSFWMKNTLIPLDIIYLDSDGTVLNVEEAEPQPDASDSDLERYHSDGPAQYVIELDQGFSEEHGIEPGTEVVFHDDLEVEADDDGS
ncbi:DUF192 domain-containing protein [Natronoglomus mannanivorans]|uniref:DUF192 domain-containing protein n=1 Tax=Natronoglomus mannanivorans TaxID=2979990 RepID=A0AAP2Z1N1_9EURY|nr:DUF192 domain-containing protein [Halobacteria archaeon AArc-xg1-1]